MRSRVNEGLILWGFENMAKSFLLLLETLEQMGCDLTRTMKKITLTAVDNGLCKDKSVRKEVR